MNNLILLNSDRLKSYSFTPSADLTVTEATLSQLIRPRLNEGDFVSDITRLQQLHERYCNHCPPPWAASRLKITSKAIIQSEQWLPLAFISSCFYRFFCKALTFPPFFLNTIFSSELSWFEIVATFPAWLEKYANPAKLLKNLIIDHPFRIKFIFWSFMPKRYYGYSSNRYPLQMNIAKQWLENTLPKTETICCLDSVCGDGACVYAFADMALKLGYSKDEFKIEGWSLDPLEVWAAVHRRFYHDAKKEERYSSETNDIFISGAETSILFKNYDLLNSAQETITENYHIILCNGLLGGPIINQTNEIHIIISNLIKHLHPHGILLAANHFHDGWEKSCPETKLIDIFSNFGLETSKMGEGIGGIKKGIPM